ncbi:hypothetical protein VMUT_0902 [Vulcanisaeta moutnovskia 768-28]|uniref:Uncharacterized protein n=1 Tax=Vulcanisaeta moutnovskia (strain 768-28) TaxID=985053 RepID=F0QWZ4_VULM7|nr:hypothetical protein [Vulcanisaeta moutnovskia]ADY01112.1 hypothetical protein VMUT_0902 [Vulcanisaeta moutnovskia 768-28]
MAIRVRIKLSSVMGKTTVTKALVTTGYETQEPEILIPRSIAEDLDLLPKLPSGSEIRNYVLADGSVTRLILVPNAVQVWILENDREVGGVMAHVVISERADEALLSDKLVSKLGIVLLDIGEGTWCFRDEIGKITRKSL